MITRTFNEATNKSEDVRSTSHAMWAYLISRIAGEDLVNGVVNTLPGTGEYWASTFNGTASAAAKTLGAVGAAGDILEAFTIYNNSGSPFTDLTITDGSTVLTALDLGAGKTLATGSRYTFTMPGGMPKRSQNGAWKVTVTCIGTMANIAIFVAGSLS